MAGERVECERRKESWMVVASDGGRKGLKKGMDGKASCQPKGRKWSLKPFNNIFFLFSLILFGF